jgi:hypothetical protein
VLTVGSSSARTASTASTATVRSTGSYQIYERPCCVVLPLCDATVDWVSVAADLFNSQAKARHGGDPLPSQCARRASAAPVAVRVAAMGVMPAEQPREAGSAWDRSQ